MSNTKYFCNYGMARPLSVKEAAFCCGVTKQRIYQLLKNGIVKNSEVPEFPIDGKSLLKWTSSRSVSMIPGTSLITYSLNGLMEASGRGRCYALKMVDANHIAHHYIFDKVHFDKVSCDAAMRMEDPLCRK